MSEKIFSVRVVKALMEDCLNDGITSLTEKELLEILEIKITNDLPDSIKEALNSGDGTYRP